MRLVTLLTSDRETVPGVLISDCVLNLVAGGRHLSELASLPSSIRAILQTGPEALDAISRLLGKIETKSELLADLEEAGAVTKLSDANLLAPIPDPALILSCGLNYHEHLREMNTPVPATPTAFTKNAASVIGTGEPILLPKTAPAMVDWEGEFTLVIGKPCFGVRASDALSYVAGYTIVNDVSARDWVPGVFAAKGNMPSILAWEHNILGKQYPTFCPMGPALVTADEVGDISDLKLETRLNGKVMQSTTTADLVFHVPQLIEYFSKFYKLRPGDLITTGSPSGVGYGRDPKVFMQVGDVIEVQVERVGVLRNPVLAG
jgi:2-keto-4-pentenoate hydratase/2-oxohepta-3-ene-1,7-dioic acid hydratase in catechol pathway